MRFDGTSVLLDPYSRSVVVPKSYNRDDIRNNAASIAAAMKSVVVDTHAYDWERDSGFDWMRGAPARRPHSRTIIYEMHVRGFTQHPNSGVEESSEVRTRA
jgi:glycogen operon protein